MKKIENWSIRSNIVVIDAFVIKFILFLITFNELQTNFEFNVHSFKNGQISFKNSPVFEYLGSRTIHICAQDSRMTENGSFSPDPLVWDPGYMVMFDRYWSRQWRSCSGWSRERHIAKNTTISIKKWSNTLI